MVASHSTPDRRWYLAAWLVVAAVLCAPIWLVHIPPLSDFYNHLARLHIEHSYADVPAYQEYYAVKWRLVPNLALDLLALPLLSVASLAVTAKLFLTATVLLWHLGCYRLGRAIYGRPTWRALVCSFFVYNQQLLHGYVNFAFSMGLCLLALAYWIERRDRFGPGSVVLLSVIAFQVFVAHLSGFATLAIAIAAMTVARVVARRSIDRHAILGCVPLVPGTIAFFYGFLSATGVDNPILMAPLAYNARDSLTLLTGYHPLVDLGSLVVVTVLAAFALATRVRLGVRLPLAAGVALGIAYWVCPGDIASGIEVNVRFALGAFTLLAFGLDLVVRPGARRVILWAALALFAARTVVTAYYWTRLDREFADQRRALALIERGAAVHNIFFYPAPRLLNADRVRGLALIHAPCFAAVDRDANVPTLYALAGQQPLEHRRPLYRAHRFRDDSRPDIDWPEIFGAYQYVWACRAPPPVLAPLRERARVLAEVGDCALYELQGQLPGQGDGKRAPTPAGE